MKVKIMVLFNFQFEFNHRLASQYETYSYVKWGHDVLTITCKQLHLTGNKCILLYEKHQNRRGKNIGMCG